MVYSKDDVQKELDQLETGMRLMDPQLLISSVKCPGTWIWIASILNRSGTWRRQVVHAPESVIAVDSREQRQDVPEGVVSQIRDGLAFVYPYKEATVTPSKQTATQLKGRDKDQEAAENAGKTEYIHRTWRKPSFVDVVTQSNERGTAMHTVMQYIRFENCRSVAGVREEVERLIREGYLTRELSTAIAVEQIAAFFETSIGQRVMQGGEQVLREFKFSLLVDGTEQNGLCDGDKILLQGVVDCAIIEADGITVVDFKSDRVSENGLADAVSQYSLQVKTYADAISRIYQLPVKTAQLYFFHLNQFITVI